MTTTYSNPFHDIRIINSKKVIETDAKPVEYKGFKIYHRVKSSSPGGDVYDIVLNNTCVGMMAGLSGAKNRIDNGDFDMEILKQAVMEVAA